MSLEVNITKKLDGFTLHANFAARSTATAILGASGCGKSMTLRCIAGIVKPDAGRIVLDGRVLFDSAQHIDLPPQQRGVGLLFQNYALFPNMTVEQNVLCGLKAEKDKAARKARCASCGYTLRSSVTNGRRYLQCPNRHVAKDACTGAFISVDKLEGLVIDELNRLAAEYLDKDELERSVEFCDGLSAQRSRLLSDIAAYEKKAAEYAKGLRELYLDKVRGLLSEGDYIELSHDFTAERDRLEQMIADAQRQLNEIEERQAAGDNRRELIEQYTHLTHLTRPIVETLIDYISVGRRIPGTKDVPIEIHWSF